MPAKFFRQFLPNTDKLWQAPYYFEQSVIRGLTYLVFTKSYSSLIDVSDKSDMNLITKEIEKLQKMWCDSFRKIITYSFLKLAC